MSTDRAARRSRRRQAAWQFVFRAVDEVGATLNAALVVMGDKLGLYRALAGAGGAATGGARRSAPAPPSATSASG